jgi:hypothetical protein
MVINSLENTASEKTSASLMTLAKDLTANLSYPQFF